MQRSPTLRHLVARRAAPPSTLCVSQRQLHLATGKPSIVAATIDDWGKHWSGSMIATKGDFKRDRSIRSFSLNADAAASAAFENVSSLSGDELNTQISSLLESGEITKAGDLIHQAQTDAITDNNPDQLPTMESYTSYLTALLTHQKQLQLDRSDREAAIRILSLAEKAHNLLVHMEEFSGVSDTQQSFIMKLSGTNNKSRIRQPALRPTSFHYDTVIESFANATTAAQEGQYTTHFTMNAPYIAQRWLQRMETLQEPTTLNSYYHVMKACSVIAMMNQPLSSSKSSILTQAIFDKLKQNPNLTASAREYRLLLQTWSCSNCKDSAYKATGVWMSMQRAFRRGEDQSMEPTLEDGKMVLRAWSRAINKHSARRANSVLTEMQKKYNGKTTTVQPDLDCYRYVLSAMSKSKVPDIAASIPNLFKSMEDNQIFPDTECFDCAIQTLTNCTRNSTKENEAVEYSKMAEKMLIQMEKESERSSVSVVKPSSKSYTNVIQALGLVRRGKSSAEKAAALLKRMEGGDESIRPTRDSYVGVMNAFGSCGSEDGFISANEILQRMISQYSNGNESVRPDACSYHAVIRACSQVATSGGKNPERQKEALVLAISTVQDMKKSDHVHPNTKSYLLLLQCCINLLPEGSTEREKALCSVFRSCAKDGLVGQPILREFQSNVSAEVYHREVVSIAPYFEEVRIIPEKWTRNLGYSVRGSSGKMSPIISVTGAVVSTTAYNDYRMRRRRLKKGKMLLQGGRI